MPVSFVFCNQAQTRIALDEVKRAMKEFQKGWPDDAYCSFDAAVEVAINIFMESGGSTFGKKEQDILRHRLDSVPKNASDLICSFFEEFFNGGRYSFSAWR